MDMEGRKREGKREKREKKRSKERTEEDMGILRGGEGKAQIRSGTERVGKWRGRGRDVEKKGKRKMNVEKN